MAKDTLNFDVMREKWPSEYVARTEVSRFTGGLISPRTMANIDCLGTGPSEKIRLGKKVAYPVDALIEWLNSHIVD